MATKNIRFDYYRLHQGTKGSRLNKCLEDIKKELQTKPKEVLRNKTVSGYVVRFRELKKIQDSSHSRFYWIGHIEKIDTFSEAYVGKIDGDRDTYGDGVDEGPIKDTIVLFDPFNDIISAHRTNALSYNQLNNFLLQITDDEDLDLEVVVDDRVVDRLEKIPGIREIEYSIAAPQRWSRLASDNRSINGDLELGDKLEAGRMKIIITPEKGQFINRAAAVKKLKALLPYANEEVSVLKVKGNVSNDTDTLDLINGKMETLKSVNLTKGQKLTFVTVKEKIEEAYLEKKKLLDRMFISIK